MDEHLTRGYEHDRCRGFFLYYRCDTDSEGDDFEEEDDKSGSKIVPSRTEYGQMMDFLQKNTSITREQYLWEWSVPQIKLASCDFSHVVYLGDKAKAQHFDTIDDFMSTNNLGVLTKE